MIGRRVIYFGPALHPTELVIVGAEPAPSKLVSLARPESEDVVVSGVALGDAPCVGGAVLIGPPVDPPAKKLTKKEQAAADAAEKAAAEAAEKAAAESDEVPVDVAGTEETEPALGL